ncbi:hypothetical protein Ade02nite_70600 [Paractinoplanes deccanensis]|uniref:Uncharacterized protein n=1 Tax=Paractinoplanes deccanensis TaxID=113561 RepID=A0ABQ3YEK0_9ACTN|nr:hypothetical protein [Actinoplanes deccanensis]GID78419.1 hypothetical protein Ade02nite_70600 [Actinoplanes deccanensis]
MRAAPGRRWRPRGGATAEETARTLPGDRLLPRPDVVSTRAVTIDAPASSVWPWLVRLGSDALPIAPWPGRMRVEICEPERTLVLRTADGAWVWSLSLSTVWLKTRLISRNRIVTAGRHAAFLRTEPRRLLVERRLLRDIKQRAESIAPSAWSPPLPRP